MLGEGGNLSVKAVSISLYIAMLVSYIWENSNIRPEMGREKAETVNKDSPEGMFLVE